MAEIVLEKIDNSPEENTEPEPEPEIVEEHVEEAVEPVETQIPEPPAVKRPRGRPPKAKAEPKAKAPAKPKPKARPPKAKPPPPEDSSSDSSTDVEDTLRTVYKHHVARPDMETAILQMLVNRRASEQEKRRNLWGQLARF